MLKKILALIVLAVTGITTASYACTRIVYRGDSNLYIIGRSLDWKTPIPTNLYVYPRGVKFASSSRAGAFSWTSRYSAVYAVGYDAGITEGMNEKGLQVASLFCKTAQYSDSTNNNRRPVSLAVFVAWLLDSNETTDQVLRQVEKQDFTLAGSTFDGGTETKLHFGVTDRFGASAIIEFEAGKIHTYRTDSINAMSNDPEWPQMSAIVQYWRNVGGVNMLPGTVRSADRCVRGAFFADNVDKVADADLGASITRSVMFNVSVPYLYTVKGEPNVSSTQWRSLCNLRDLRYYFDIATANGLFYIDLGKCDLKPGAPVLKLVTADCTDVTGMANRHLRKAEPFVPIH